MVRSLRSNEVVAGKTISAWRAAAVQKYSEIQLCPLARPEPVVGIPDDGSAGAARPPDKADVGKAPRHPVVLIACAGVYRPSTMRATGIFFHRVHAARYATLHEASTAARRVGCCRWQQSGKKDRNRRRACQSAPASPPASPAVQCFCSPNRWRCMPQPDISMVVFSWKSFASSRIFPPLRRRLPPPIRRFYDAIAFTTQIAAKMS